MDVQTVIANLRNTIAGKEMLLADLKKNRDAEDESARWGGRAPDVHFSITIRFLESNLEELRKILEDLVQCVW